MIEPKYLVFELAYIVASAGLLALAFRSKSEWVKASLAAFAISVLGWRLLAVLPSWWLYYADGELGLGGQGCVKIDGDCLKQAMKDTVVVIENGVVLAGFVVAFIIYQKKFPKQLASGESKPEATGGYK